MVVGGRVAGVLGSARRVGSVRQNCGTNRKPLSHAVEKVGEGDRERERDRHKGSARQRKRERKVD